MNTSGKKVLGYIMVSLFVLLIGARIFYPVTPVWLDVIFIIAIVVFLLVIKIDRKKPIKNE
jgi:4-amino-4-deoxy-L-arabinose transferase-like glycosyltransferase